MSSVAETESEAMMMADELTEAGKNGIVVGTLAAHQVLSQQMDSIRGV